MADSWLPDLSVASGAKYQAIADALGAAIETGVLQHGARIPPQREVAAKLGVDLTTVTKAYDAARQLGLIEARGRAGSFVIHQARPPLPESARIDTGMNMPPELPGDMFCKAMAETSSALLTTFGASLLQYQAPGGAPQDRAAGAAYLASTGLQTDEEQVLVTAGGQNALHAVLGSILKPGDAIACGHYVYSGFRALAQRLGLNLVPLPEMSAAALAHACAVHDIRALYLVPTNDNPTGVTLSLADRIAIAEAARDHQVQIIEDDAYGALAVDPIPPISVFAPERSWHIASMSKLISPALRVAYVRAPSVAAAINLAADVHETAIMAPPLNAALVTAWFADGTFNRLIDAMRREASARQQLADSALEGIERQRHPQGYHIWLPLPDGMRANELVAAMRPSGLSIIAGHRFAVEDDAPQAVRVSLGGLIDRERLTRALRILHGHIASPGRRRAPIV